MFKKFKTEEYKSLFWLFGSLVVCLLLVLIISGILGIINRIKGPGPAGITPSGEISYKNTITVRGQGRVYTKPDVAVINLSVITEGRDIGDVQRENIEKMNRVITFLKGFDVAEKDIKTINYRILPHYSYEEGRAPRIASYKISQTLKVKMRNLDKIGEILEKSVDVGINQISSLAFENDDEEALKQEARKLAIEDAKEKARELASQLGVKIVRISGFDEDTFDYPIFRELGLGGGEAPQVEIGENEIVVYVTLIYEID